MNVGDKAKKVGGSYQAVGTVVSTFHTTAGDERVVFEFDEPKGLLHIFHPAQLQPVDTSKEKAATLRAIA